MRIDASPAIRGVSRGNLLKTSGKIVTFDAASVLICANNSADADCSSVCAYRAKLCVLLKAAQTVETNEQNTFYYYHQ